MKICPLDETARPSGLWSCPDPEPWEPKVVMKAPAGENSCTRSPPSSDTYRLPLEGSVAMPQGPFDLPVPEPAGSKVPRDIPSVENSCTLEFPYSETYRLPPEMARPHEEMPIAPAAEPVEPNLLISVPVAENSSIRAPSGSPRAFRTHTSPEESIAIAPGEDSEPGFR